MIAETTVTVAERKESDFQFWIAMAVATARVLLEEHGAERQRLLSAAIENLENARRLPGPRHLKLVPCTGATTPSEAARR